MIYQYLFMICILAIVILSAMQTTESYYLFSLQNKFILKFAWHPIKTTTGWIIFRKYYLYVAPKHPEGGYHIINITEEEYLIYVFKGKAKPME